MPKVKARTVTRTKGCYVITTVGNNYMHLPTQRKLPPDAKEKATKLLEMKANK